jgi:myosin light chain 6
MSGKRVGSKDSFSEDQVTEFQEAFMLFDTKGDGMIPASQVGGVLRALGQNPTESEVRRLVQTTANQKTKEDDRITFETFLPILQTVSQKPITDTVEDFIEGLRHFDKGGDGFISSAELRHMLTSLGEKMSEEEVENLIHGQEDSHGNINYEEFVRMVLAN